MGKNFVRLRRKQQRVTISELAGLTKIPGSVISMIENGLLMPDFGLQIRLARALHTKRDKLFPKI